MENMSKISLSQSTQKQSSAVLPVCHFQAPNPNVLATLKTSFVKFKTSDSCALVLVLNIQRDERLNRTELYPLLIIRIDGNWQARQTDQH